jgi:hypothetical protein
MGVGIMMFLVFSIFAMGIVVFFVGIYYQMVLVSLSIDKVRANVDSLLEERCEALATLDTLREGHRDPGLMTDESLAPLIKHICDLDTEISEATLFYNESAAVYNTRLRRTPERLLVIILRYEPREMLSDNELENT